MHRITTIKLNPSQENRMSKGGAAENHAKLQLNTPQRNISKLVFYSSEDQASSSQEDPQILCHTARVTSNPPLQDKPVFRETIRGQSLMLRPSLMQTQDCDHDYNIIIPKRDNFVECVEAKDIKLARNVQNIHYISESQQDKEEQAETTHAPLADEAPLVEQPLIKVSAPSSQMQHSSSEEEEEFKQEAHSVQQQQQTDRSIENHKTSLLHISHQVKQRSAYFSEIIHDSHNPEDISKLMFAPIHLNTVQIFEVHVYSSLLEKTFELWMDGLPTMKLLMKASKSLKLHKTSYEITTYIEQCRQFCQACKITSNIDRSEFNIENQRSTGKTLLGSISCNTTFKNDKNLVLFYPRINPNTKEPYSIAFDEQTSSLKQFYRDQKEEKVEYIMTTKIKIQERLELMKQHGLRPSQKSMQFKGKEGDLKMIIGKKGSKRYSIMAGCPLTPVQLFSLAIINIETS